MSRQPDLFIVRGVPTPPHERWRSIAAMQCARDALRLGEIADTAADVQRAYDTCRELCREELFRLRDDYARRIDAHEHHQKRTELLTASEVLRKTHR